MRPESVIHILIYLQTNINEMIYRIVGSGFICSCGFVLDPQTTKTFLIVDGYSKIELKLTSVE